MSWQRLCLKTLALYWWAWEAPEKTHLAKDVIQQLRDLGHQVEIVAYTHLAAQNIGGCTIRHFLHSHQAFSGILVIDEGSFVPVALWNELARYQLSGAKFLVLGDV